MATSKRRTRTRIRSSMRKGLIPIISVFAICLLAQRTIRKPGIVSPKSRLLPPPLDITVQHHLRSHIPFTPLPDWKRPRILTAHAFRTINKAVLEVAVFSTGTDTQAYGRKFHPVACIIGSRVFNASIVRPEVTICEVHPPPESGQLISILLRFDDELRDAMARSVTLFGEKFELLPNDVVPLPKHTLSHEPAVASVRSELLWNHNMIDTKDPSQPRYELCLMTAMKQYPYLLPGFLSYYRRLGVDQVFIYDNAAETDLKEIVSAFDFVQVVFWPWTRSQMQSFTHFVRAARCRCKFVAFFDADEYIMVGSKSPDALKRYVHLRMHQGYGQIIAHFVRFFNSGYIRRPKGDLPLLYTRREKDQSIKLGKSIIDVDRLFLFHKIHIVEGRNTKTYWNTTLDISPTTLLHNAMLMHFTKRSWEENILKKQNGGSSPMTNYRKPMPAFHDVPDSKYMDLERSIPFTGFVDYWRAIMQLPLPLRQSLLWNEGKLWCRNEYCPTCSHEVLSPKTCADSLFTSN